MMSLILKTQTAWVHGYKATRQIPDDATVLSRLRDKHDANLDIHRLHHNRDDRLRAETLPGPDAAAQSHPSATGTADPDIPGEAPAGG